MPAPAGGLTGSFAKISIIFPVGGRSLLNTGSAIARVGCLLSSGNLTQLRYVPEWRRTK